MSASTPFLALSGAVAADGVSVAAHYGSPLAEQRALEAGAAVVDLSHNGIVTVSGPDRLTWLHSMTSQSLAGLRPGESVETLLLDPNGRIERAIRLVDDGEQAWLLVDAGSAEPLAAYLQRMRFALRVEVTDRSDTHAALLAFSGEAQEMLEGAAPVVIWRDPWATGVPGGVQYARVERPGEHAGAGWSAVQAVVPRAELAAIVDTIVTSDGVRTAGLLSLDALEVRAWRPSQHGEVDERSIPHETDWMRTAVHLTKGCYRGQETVAKVHNLGHPPRRLVLLHLDGSSGGLPVAGALVYRAGEGRTDGARPVGRVTRAVLHHEWGGIALALLKRSVAEDLELDVRGGDAGIDPKAEISEITEIFAAAQETIVPGDAGATRDIPRLTRL